MVKSDRDPKLLEVGLRVRQRRRAQDFTQERLAEAAQVSKSFISEIEAGQTAASGLVYLRLAEALDANVQWLLTGEEADEPEAQPLALHPLVSALAENRQWSHKHAMDISAALQGIVARRTRDGKKWEPTKELILSIHKALEQEEEGNGS